MEIRKDTTTTLTNDTKSTTDVGASNETIGQHEIVTTTMQSPHITTYAMETLIKSVVTNVSRADGSGSDATRASQSPGGQQTAVPVVLERNETNSVTKVGDRDGYASIHVAGTAHGSTPFDVVSPLTPLTPPGLDLHITHGHTDYDNVSGAGLEKRIATKVQNLSILKQTLELLTRAIALGLSAGLMNVVVVVIVVSGATLTITTPTIWVINKQVAKIMEQTCKNELDVEKQLNLPEGREAINNVDEDRFVPEITTTFVCEDSQLPLVSAEAHNKFERLAHPKQLNSTITGN